MGGPTALAFLHTMPASWKREHLAAFVPISPPFGGAISTVKALVSGDTLGIPFVQHALFHPIQSTCASGPWLFPQPSLWPKPHTIVTSGAAVANGSSSTAWTSSDYVELAGTLGLHQAAAMFDHGVNALALASFTAPGVTTEVLRGDGVATPATLTYDAPFQSGVVPDAPHVQWEYDGDGTVNGRSLERASKWVGEQAEPVRLTRLHNTTHFGILTAKPTLDKLSSILTSL